MKLIHILNQSYSNWINWHFSARPSRKIKQKIKKVKKNDFFIYCMVDAATQWPVCVPGRDIKVSFTFSEKWNKHCGSVSDFTRPHYCITMYFYPVKCAGNSAMRKAHFICSANCLRGWGAPGSSITQHLRRHVLKQTWCGVCFDATSTSFHSVGHFRLTIALSLPPRTISKFFSTRRRPFCLQFDLCCASFHRVKNVNFELEHASHLATIKPRKKNCLVG